MKKFARTYALLFTALFVAWGLSGCGAAKKVIDPTIAQLEDFKKRQAQNDFAWIAAQNVDCAATKAGCNQLHLLKGDACFRLAKEANAANNKEEAKAHYSCAASEIEAGMQQTNDWQIAGPRPQWYENLCETLRNWQDLEKGAQADQLTNRLLETAKRFRAEEAEHPAAIYFVNGAQFTLLRKEILNPTDEAALCAKLNAIIQDLTQAQPRAGARYTANYQQLRSDVTGVKPAGCQ